MKRLLPYCCLLLTILLSACAAATASAMYNICHPTVCSIRSTEPPAATCGAGPWRTSCHNNPYTVPTCHPIKYTVGAMEAS